MAQNDNAVITAAVGHVYVNTPGAARPSVAAITNFNPETFGAQSQEIKLSSGTASGGTFSVAGVADTPVDIAHNATAAEVQAAIESLESIGVGNAVVSGTAVGSGYTVTFVGALQGTAVTALVLDDADLTGSTPVLPAAATVTVAPNGWKNLGHTSRDDMPEFGYEGGDTEVKGTWQNEALREVVTEALADFLTLFLHEFGTDTFELYFGENDSIEAGVFGVANGSKPPVEKAFLVVITDGETNIGFYAAKASVRRDDSIQMPVDEFTAFPIRATFLKLGNRLKFEWINEDLFD